MVLIFVWCNWVYIFVVYQHRPLPFSRHGWGPWAWSSPCTSGSAPQRKCISLYHCMLGWPAFLVILSLSAWPKCSGWKSGQVPSLSGQVQPKCFHFMFGQTIVWPRFLSVWSGAKVISPSFSLKIYYADGYGILSLNVYYLFPIISC